MKKDDCGIEKRKKNRGGLSTNDERRIREKLRSRVPSEPWLDAQFFQRVERGQRGEWVVCRVHDPRLFPPGGAQTLMVRCPECLVFNPPMAFENGVCLDHADDAAWGPSPSAVAIRALQWRNLRITETELPPESTRALREEIKRHIEKE